MAKLNIPVKIGACMNCSAPVQIKTNPKVNCAACRLSRKREQSIKGAAVQRRKNGVPESKGVNVTCPDCMLTFTKINHKTVRCRDCQRCATLARARKASAAKYATAAGKIEANAYHKAKTATDARFALNVRMKVLTCKALGKRKAGRSWRSLVPYTLDELMLHIERQFLPDMTWDNRDKWHIDHITPVSKFKFDSAEHGDFKACWALSNLRPMWARDNLQKNATVIYLL